MAIIVALLQMKAIWAPDHTLRRFGQFRQIHVLSQRSFPGVDFKYFQPFFFVRDGKMEHIIQPPGTHQGGIEQIFPIRRSKDNNLGMVG